MQAVARTRRISITFRPRTPRRIIREISLRYGEYIEPEAREHDDLIEWKETELHKEIVSSMTPGKHLLAIRELTGLSQAEFGRKIGTSAKRISDWENNRRGISKRAAKKIATLFNYPAEKLL